MALGWRARAHFTRLKIRSCLESRFFHDSNSVTNNCLPFPPTIQARILSAQYKALPEKEMKKWTKQAEADKLRYQEEMADYVPMEKPGGKRKKAKKDPNAPKRNMSAYFLYSIEARPVVKEENPEATFGEIARIISAKFKGLSDSEKAKWEKKAAEDKERYQREMEAYNS
eukprot:CAMPEP_0176035620 /NCGR_PEP_ID=MMETSP0120_2-20121206/17627_1 /TAXON_ID=160619 /ORGANISM="Kryptoperidinium foliaceum, Strain CCMP 1326" /LENGTH=169 /DNA_ID=CAMNT_0017368987 /DNA_START=683 /DNA_END=1192 /DNA_ORIENTATION=+